MPHEQSSIHITPGSDAALDRRRILLAEDDRDMRELLSEALRHDGYEVIEASHGSELMQLLAARLSESGQVDRVDLIISDVCMPGWSGVEVLEALRDSHAEVPVILITAFKDDGLGERAEALHAYTVFDKPFDIDELRTAVYDAISS